MMPFSIGKRVTTKSHRYYKRYREYFCKRNKKENVHGDLSTEFRFKIMEMVQRLANQATSLIYDVDSNTVEQFNAIVCKFVGGKCCNFSLKKSYEAKCYAAVVSHNSKSPHTLF